MDKLKNLGNRALAVPFGIALLLFCVLGLAMAPMMHMEPKSMPVVLVNLDEGADLPTGEHLVAGDLVEENIQEAVDENGGDGEPPMRFTSLSSREELDENIADYYGAIVIPADFTEKQIAGNAALATTLGQGLQELMASQQQAEVPDPAALVAAQASPEAAASAQQQVKAAMASQLQAVVQDAVAAQQDAEKPAVELVANVAKSPVFASTMQSSMVAALAEKGVSARSSKGAEPSSLHTCNNRPGRLLDGRFLHVEHARGLPVPVGAGDRSVGLGARKHQLPRAFSCNF